MPFYEYRCEECGHRFEELVPSVSSPAPPCPSCQADAASKLPSAFAVGRAAPSAPAAPPGAARALAPPRAAPSRVSRSS